MRILLTTGAIRNVGDHLIHDRARRLVAEAMPEIECVSIPRWKKASDRLIDSAAAVVCCGGPALNPKLFKRICIPLQQAVDRGVPISVLGVGWQGGAIPDLTAAPEDFQRGMRHLESTGGVVSTRDLLSLGVLRQWGIEGGICSGCPAWYDLSSIESELQVGDQVRRLVVTTPARLAYFDQLDAVVEMMARMFPEASRSLVLHRGFPRYERLLHRRRSPIESVAHLVTMRKAGARYRIAVEHATRLGYEIVDAEGDLSRISDYGSCDLHVGYRVHAHIGFLSRRRPSILLAEDRRGVGQQEVLDDRYRLRADDADVVHELETALNTETRTWESSRRGVARMQATWPEMRKVLNRIANQVGLDFK